MHREFIQRLREFHYRSILTKAGKSIRAPNWLVVIVALWLLVFITGCSGTPDDAHQDITTVLSIDAEPVLGLRGIDLTAYAKIPLEANQLEVSSILQPGMDKDQLVQPGVEGFWHVKSPKTEEKYAWASAIFDTARPVALLRVLPRKGVGWLMWRGYTAALQVSYDGKEWATIATLGIVPWPPEDDWINFLVLVPEPYPYYRLFVADINFMSLARLELYQLTGYGPPLPTADLTPTLPSYKIPSAPSAAGAHYLDTSDLKKLAIKASDIQVSSVQLPTMSRDSLVQPGREGFWHVKAPREEIPAWVTVSLDAPVSLSAIHILPRAGQTAQLWDGNTAILEGSHDAADWIPLATLSLNKSELRNDWIGFLLDNLPSFQFYRISIYDPQFFSIARLEFYTSP